MSAKRALSRDAGTGLYVTLDFAKANPGTTVTERANERAAIVAFLRDARRNFLAGLELADQIEAGEHLKDPD